MDENKITIIEGPPPVFEPAHDGWALGMGEGPHLGFTAITRLRTFNGASLVERCHRAWRAGQSTMLEYRTSDGLTQQAPILAARWLDIQDGQVLLLWVRLDEGEIEVEFEVDDDADEESDDPDLTQGQ